MITTNNYQNNYRPNSKIRFFNNKKSIPLNSYNKEVTFGAIPVPPEALKAAAHFLARVGMNMKKGADNAKIVAKEIDNLAEGIKKPHLYSTEDLEFTMNKIPAIKEGQGKHFFTSGPESDINEIKSLATQSNFLRHIPDDSPIHRQSKKDFLFRMYDQGHTPKHKYISEKKTGNFSNDLRLSVLDNKQYADFKKEIASKMMYSDRYKANLKRNMELNKYTNEEIEALHSARIADTVVDMHKNKEIFSEFVSENGDIFHSRLTKHVENIKAANEELDEEKFKSVFRWLNGLEKEKQQISTANEVMETKLIKILKDKDDVPPSSVILQGNSGKEISKLLTTLAKNENIIFKRLKYTPNNKREVIRELYDIKEDAAKTKNTTGKRTVVFVDGLEKMLKDKESSRRLINSYKSLTEEPTKKDGMTILFHSSQPLEIDSAVLSRSTLITPINKYT